MKIKPLIILNRRQKYNSLLHGGFLDYAKKLGIDALYYGPNTEGISSPLHFKGVEKIHKVIEEKNRNILIVYRSDWLEDLEWIPCSLWSTIDIPKIIIEVDYYKFRTQHKDNLVDFFDLQFLRYPTDMEYSKYRNKELLLWSIDPKIYSIGSMINRHSICYSGITCAKVDDAIEDIYQVRYDAVKQVKADVKRLFGKKQAQFYKQHIAAINSLCYPYNLLNAKNFEISGTGTLLFVDKNECDTGLKNALPSGTYIEYQRDCSDIKYLWQEVRNNREYWLRQAMIAAKHVHKNHTHKNRWNRIVECVKKYKLL